MSGFAYNLKNTTAMTPVAYITDDESAGKVGKILGVVAAIVMPFAAPVIWGAVAGSGGILAGLGGALTGAFGAGAAQIIGSAAVGALGNAALAYAGGARGGSVWSAALSGGLGAGLGAWASGASAAANAASGAANAAPGATAGLNAIGGSGPVVLAPTATATAAGAPANIAIGATIANGAASSGAGSSIISAITRRFGSDPQLISRLGAAVVNAAVNGGNVQGMEDLVAQQRAELEALKQQDAAAYAQRIGAAKSVLDLAAQSDPDWLGRVRMADVKGMETNQFRQTMRNIATRQGGTLDFGQRKATQRSANLRIARDSALAYNTGRDEGVNRQANLYGQAAGLFTGPNLGPWQQGAELELGLQNYRNQARRSNAGVFSDAVFGHPQYQQPTSPENNNNNDDDDPFTQGQNSPWNWG